MTTSCPERWAALRTTYYKGYENTEDSRTSLFQLDLVVLYPCLNHVILSLGWPTPAEVKLDENAKQDMVGCLAGEFSSECFISVLKN
jgi:hypothetical protein